MTTRDSQLVALLENLLLTPTSDFYLSKVLHDPGQGGADPLHVDAVDLGTVSVAGIPMAISLTDLTVKGLSNVQVILTDGKPDIQVDGNTVTFGAKLPNTQSGYTRPADVPEKLEMNGTLNVTINGTGMPPGTVAVTMASINPLRGVFEATEDQGGKLDTARITFRSVSVTAEETPADITITVNVDTAFCATINEVLNHKTYYAEIFDQLNARLAEAMDGLSSTATEAARKALSNM